MLSRETFKSAIAHIQEQKKNVEEFSAALAKLCDGIPTFDMDNHYLYGLLAVLKEAMHDESDCIGWWLYEASDYTISWTENGKEVEMNVEAVDDLYDFLVLNAAQIAPERLPMVPRPEKDKGTPYKHMAMELSDFTNCFESVLSYLDNADAVLYLTQDGADKYVIMRCEIYDEMTAWRGTSEKEQKNDSNHNCGQ